MLCPNCQSEVRDDAAFCGACGAALPQQPPLAVTAADAAPAPQSAAPAPAPSAAPASDAAGYAQQALPKKKSKVVLIVAILVIALLLIIGCGIGGVFAYRALNSADTGTSFDSDAGVVEPDSSSSVGGFATAEQAVRAQMADEGIEDWLYQLDDEGDGYATYWVGPPASEWVEEMLVEQSADGSWRVAEVRGLDFGDDAWDGAMEAEFVVVDHLNAVMEDRGLDAQALTIDPFHADSASSQVSAGAFDSFEVVGTTGQSDGSLWVATTQAWHGVPQNWEYLVVPTEVGYRIADVRPW